MITLDEEEQDILQAFEEGKLERVKNAKVEMARLRQIASQTTGKDARISLHISSKDLHALQTRAVREGIPCQTLIARILHKYVDGQLVDQTQTKNGGKA